MIAARRPCLALAVAGVLAGLAAAPDAAAESRIVRNYTVEDGLAQTSAKSLTEDRQGYLWVGTGDGVSRFDGTGFTDFRSPEGLPAGSVYVIHVVSHPGLRKVLGGNLVVATDNGLTIWHDGRFLDPPANGPFRELVRDIAETPDGRLLLARRDRVDVLTPDGRVAPLPLGEKVARPRAVLATRTGIVLVGDGPRLFEVRGRNVRRFGPGDGLGGDVQALREGRDGRVWVGTSGGLSVWRPAGARGALTPMPEITDSVMALEEGRDGTLYVGTANAGLKILRGGAVDTLTTEQGLLWNGVIAIRETSSGAVYVGTGRGLGVYQGDKVRSWTRKDGLPDLVWSIAHDHRGTWLGTGRGLVLQSAGERRLFGPGDGLPHESVRHLLSDRDGHLWIATEGGVAILDRRQGVERPRFRVLGRQDGLTNNYARFLWQAPDGAIWIATQGGIAIWREGRIRTLTDREGLPTRDVNSLAGAPDGSVWAGTWNGLAQIVLKGEDVKIRSWGESDGLADELVWSVRVGRDGTVWAGTAHGLGMFRDGRFRTFDARRGLTNDTIYCMEEDARGRLYVSTNRGVNILDFSGGPGLDPVIRTLRRQDGLASDEGDLAACRRDALGRIWFGNVAGVSVYDPARDPLDRPYLPVHISGLRLFGKELPLSREALTFESQENYFEFSFIGIDLAAPHGVRYRYRLRGLDRDWIYTDRRSVQYTNLDPGEYQFLVQAASVGGDWSGPATLPFTIESPLWQRWWFVLLTLLAAAAVVGWLFTLRVRQLLAIERLRTALAADLHDHIGTGLTEISILSEIASHRANLAAGQGEGAPPPELARVADTARQLVDRMNDIVWLVNPRRDSLHELFLRLKDSYAELFSHAGVLFRTTNLRVFENVRLPMDYRQNLYLIFKEALHNSLRHSGCQEIELSVSLQGRRLEVILRDNGRGFDPAAEHSGGNGLENMRTRAERIGGELRIEAAPDRGTSVRFEGSLA